LTKEQADQFIKNAESKKLKGYKLDQEVKPTQPKTTDEL